MLEAAVEADPEAAPLSPSLVPSVLVSATDDASSEVAFEPELPPKLKEQPVSMPNERMETNKVFLFIFVFTVKNRYFPFFFVCFYEGYAS